MDGNSLEIFLQQKSWGAVDEARQLGKSAMPILKKYSHDADYQKRQIAVESAGAVGGDEAAQILVDGLKDENIGVNLSAAHTLAKNPNPGATETVIELLNTNDEEVFREALALAAGGLPGEKTVEVLKRIEAAGEDQVSVNAQMALAKLGDGPAKQAIMKQLDAAEPRTRYNALEKLIYINDVRLARYARKLLGDKNPALRTGLVNDPEYRRVCDQAVDTIVFLLKLPVSFEVSSDIIYTDREILEVESMTE
jgi:HEAT repeat protein